METQKCNRCHVKLSVDKFKQKRCGNRQKLCIDCNEKMKERQTKCEHGRQKCRCKECGGTSFCEHKIRRNRCAECGVLQYVDIVNSELDVKTVILMAI